MKINLYVFSSYFYFAISTENNSAHTSKSISKLLNLDIEIYNKILVEKVVKHNRYTIDKYNDLSFDSNGILKETYIERFKNTFVDQLTTLALGGIHSNEN